MNLQVIVKEDCGNAPKKIVLRDFFIAIAEKDTQTILNHVNDNITYTEIGKIEIQGTENFLTRIEEIIPNEISVLDLTNIITHGKTTAVNGKVETTQGQIFHFASIVILSSAGKAAKIKKMTNYIITS